MNLILSGTRRERRESLVVDYYQSDSALQIILGFFYLDFVYFTVFFLSDEVVVESKFTESLISIERKGYWQVNRVVLTVM